MLNIASGERTDDVLRAHVTALATSICGIVAMGGGDLAAAIKCAEAAGRDIKGLTELHFGRVEFRPAERGQKTPSGH
ncbi:MAG: hypothetical protein AAFR84_12955 [Pseudomonadota bacterium]